jgi:hypothetical protein
MKTRNSYRQDCRICPIHVDDEDILIELSSQGLDERSSSKLGQELTQTHTRSIIESICKKGREQRNKRLRF